MKRQNFVQWQELQTRRNKKCSELEISAIDHNQECGISNLRMSKPVRRQINWTRSSRDSSERWANWIDTLDRMRLKLSDPFLYLNLIYLYPWFAGICVILNYVGKSLAMLQCSFVCVGRLNLKWLDRLLTPFRKWKSGCKRDGGWHDPDGTLLQVRQSKG